MQLREEQIPSRCPKCHGPWVRERDRWGEYVQCLPCGLTVDIIVGTALTERELQQPNRSERTV